MPVNTVLEAPLTMSVDLIVMFETHPTTLASVSWLRLMDS